MKSFKTVTPKSDGGCLQEVILFTRGSKYRTLTRKLWVFQIGDHQLQEVVTHGCLTLVLSYMNFNCSLLWNFSRMILVFYCYWQATRCQLISSCPCITWHHPVILSVGRASSGRTDHWSGGWTSLHWSWFQCQFSLLCLEESQEVDGWPATFKLLACTVLYIVQNGGHYIFCFYFWNTSTYHI